MALIPITEAARRVGCKPDTLLRLCRRGRVPAVKPGRDWMIDEKDVPLIRIAPRGWPKGKPRK